MKTVRQTIMLTTVALVVSSTAQALVADKFKCRLEIKDLGSLASAKVEKDFFMARLPLSASPAPDVRLTASETTELLTLDRPKAEFGANLSFYYKHAVRIDAHGIPLEARQFTCIGLGVKYCERFNGGAHACSASSTACFEMIGNPFDPNSAWAPAGLRDGIPTFNEQTLGPVTRSITDGKGNNVGVVHLNCQYMGTFQ